MKKRANNNSENYQQNRMIERSLKTGGFLFPETFEDVREFERIFGATDVILPAELQEPTFIYPNEKVEFNSVEPENDNFAMAAREGTSELPKEIQQKIINDIKSAEKKIKKG